jgi:filamentous hemagglutinin
MIANRYGHAMTGYKAIHGPFHRGVAWLLIGGLLFATTSPAFAARPGQVLPAGTVPIPRAVFFGQASIRAPSAITGGNLLTIDQLSQKAIIDWESFDIARGSEVKFNQPNASASALNRIHSLDPSIIQGKLTANGQIYLINQNGILFDRGSQVNVHTLLASTLNLDPELFKAGILSNAGSVPDFLPFASGASGSIEIGVHGDLHEVARIDTQAGGAVIVLAPAIVNDGIITSPDGQVILAAGNRAFLYANPNPNDFKMRGLLVQVEASGTPVNLTKALRKNLAGRVAGSLAAQSGDVFNLGEIHTDRGNTTLAGFAVNQAGLISARTAVNQNGSIWLTAAGGRVVTTADSRTVTPIMNDNTTALKEDQSFEDYRPIVKIEANRILHQGSIVSPAGRVSLSATGAGSRVLLDNGSTIDVSGSWADLQMSKNLLTFRVQSNDLRDAPLQKGGSLLGETVTVDARSNPALFDLALKKGAVPRTVAEKTATGGDITIVAGDVNTPGDIVMRENAILNVSGGGYRYAAGILNTTKLYSGGRSYDIGSAPADLSYRLLGESGVVTKRYEKWGVSVDFAGHASRGGAAFETAYVEGKPGGSVTIIADTMVLNGLLRAGSTAGRYQMSPTTKPSGGRMAVGDGAAWKNDLESRDLRITDIVVQSGVSALPENFGIDSVLSDEFSGRAFLSAGQLSGNGESSSEEYRQQGFSVIDLYANGRIEISDTADIEAAPGVAIGLNAMEIEIEGDIRVAGGTVNLDARPTAYKPGDLLPNRPAPEFQNIRLGATGRIDVSGQWLNDGIGPNGAPGAAAAWPSYLNGGTVNIETAQAFLDPGSVIDVSGGSRLSTSGRFSPGKGGKITIRTGGVGASLEGHALALGGDLRGYSAATGGTLDISAHSVRIANTGTGAAGELWLAPAFFQRGGFSQYTLTGTNHLEVGAGTIVQPLAQTLVLDKQRAAGVPSSNSMRDLAQVRTLDPGARSAASLTLNSAADLIIGTGSVIRTDPGASIVASTQGALRVNGTLEAPGGTIKLEVNGNVGQALIAPGLVLGSEARLLARGAYVPTPNPLGMRVGEILRGGSVSLVTVNAPLFTEAGSLIDVSGISQTKDIGGTNVRPRIEQVVVHGDAGSVLMRATEDAHIEGQLKGNAGPGAAGGSFALESVGNGNPEIFNNQRIVITRTPLAAPVASDTREAFLPLSVLKGGASTSCASRRITKFSFAAPVPPIRSICTQRAA